VSTVYQFDFAVSYAGPDQEFVEQVVAAMKARSLRVFYAPDAQADIVGRNLIDYLTEVYLSKARYCLVFVSEHYKNRKWTDRVERPAAQARALEQSSRYIIPVRLDNAKIPGMLDTVAEIRHATPKRIADLAVAILLRDESPTVVSPDADNRDRWVVRVLSLTELDTELLRQTFTAFEGWSAAKLYQIPIELRLPKFVTETLNWYERIVKSKKFQTVDHETQSQFRQFVRLMRKDFLGELLSAPKAILSPSQPLRCASLTLTNDAIELLRRYTLAKVAAAARCLVTWQLQGFPTLNWAPQFADCEPIYLPRLMGGLPWLCRAEGSEEFLWLDADIRVRGIRTNPDRIRIWLPSTMAVRRRREIASAANVLRFVAPQLLEIALTLGKPNLLHEALYYPEQFEILYRDENAIECRHLCEGGVQGYTSQEVISAIEAIRDDILREGQRDRGNVARALDLLFAASHVFRDHHRTFVPAIQMLLAEQDKYDSEGSQSARSP